MKTYVHVWQYLAESFLKWETFQTTVVGGYNYLQIFNSFFPNIMPFTR